ncbi:DUF4192 family protein [Arthrobacter sp. NPDC080031]|uniref:DUF4192 family protein n=1 Tax=Arthrobacter sp. NPDC080031 TaxID=3155918 RepID=UPI00344B1A19
METLSSKTPADVLSFIGHTLGFWPQKSLVCISLDTNHIGVTLRVDLPKHDGGERAYARTVARTLGCSGPMNEFSLPCSMGGGRRCSHAASRQRPSSSAASFRNAFSASRVNFRGNRRPVDVDDSLADLRSGEKPISLKTLRS